MLVAIMFQLGEAAHLYRRKKTFSGKATWFVPSKEGGSEGACGVYNDDDAYIVAMNSDQYGDMDEVSDLCGKTVKIKYGDNSVEAKVTDACPECDYGSLDLTQAVFKELDDLDTGVLDITWKFV